jgi:ABC-type branched-subunit amino acid transport system permease subunit
MIVSEFMTLSSFDIGITSCSNALDVQTESRFSKLCSTTGHQHHHYALLALGLLTLVLTFGMVIGRSRPAAVALATVGLAVVIIALAIDHPSFHKTHGLELLFPPNQIRGKSGTGYKVELAAAVLALAAGGLGLLRRPEERPARERGTVPAT